MKLSQLQEARYAYPNYADWVKQAVNTLDASLTYVDGTDQYDWENIRPQKLEVPLSDRQTLVKQITDLTSNKPHHAEYPVLDRPEGYYRWFIRSHKHEVQWIINYFYFLNPNKPGYLLIEGGNIRRGRSEHAVHSFQLA